MKSLLNKLIEQRFLHYLVSGVTAFIVEYATFYILISMKWPLVIANSLSFLLALATSFTLNRKWTFGHKEYDKRSTYQLSSYVVLAGINLLLTNLIVELFVHHGLDPMVSKLAAMIITSLWNFFAFKMFVFKHKKTE